VDPHQQKDRGDMQQMRWYPAEPKPPTKPGGPWLSMLTDTRDDYEWPTGSFHPTAADARAHSFFTASEWNADAARLAAGKRTWRVERNIALIGGCVMFSGPVLQKLGVLPDVVCGSITFAGAAMLLFNCGVQTGIRLALKPEASTCNE
jgi:hypothetical protein